MYLKKGIHELMQLLHSANRQKPDLGVLPPKSVNLISLIPTGSAGKCLAQNLQ